MLYTLISPLVAMVSSIPFELHCHLVMIFNEHTPFWLTSTSFPQLPSYADCPLEMMITSLVSNPGDRNIIIYGVDIPKFVLQHLISGEK